MSFAKCYIWPHELTSLDQLMDGAEGVPFEITANTLLVWIDLEPDFRFSHPTIYVLISAEGTRVERGEWWPVLNGRRILYGGRNPVAVLSPFELEKPVEPSTC